MDLPGRPDTVFFRLHDLPDTTVEAARYVVIRLTRATNDALKNATVAPDGLTGVFEGIVDIYDGKFTSIQTPVVKMWWQENSQDG